MTTDIDTMLKASKESISEIISSKEKELREMVLNPKINWYEGWEKGRTKREERLLLEKEIIVLKQCQEILNQALANQQAEILEKIDNFRAGDYDTLADIKWKLKQQLNQPKTEQ